MDFDFQVKLFTDQLVELLDDAKAQASLEFRDERSNWEQTEREFVSTIQGLESEIENLKAERDAAQTALSDLKGRLAGLV